RSRRGVPRFCFQAEDGIRGKLVTGVQTCALPISSSVQVARLPSLAVRRGKDAAEPARKMRALLSICQTRGFQLIMPACRWIGTRSEERRVGKEGRAWRMQERTTKRQLASARSANT